MTDNANGHKRGALYATAFWAFVLAQLASLMIVTTNEDWAPFVAFWWAASFATGVPALVWLWKWAESGKPPR